MSSESGRSGTKLRMMEMHLPDQNGKQNQYHTHHEFHTAVLAEKQDAHCHGSYGLERIKGSAPGRVFF
jgi:hypothetical protein